MRLNTENTRSGMMLQRSSMAPTIGDGRPSMLFTRVPIAVSAANCILHMRNENRAYRAYRK